MGVSVGQAKIRCVNSGSFSTPTDTEGDTLHCPSSQVDAFAEVALSSGRFAKPLYGVKPVSGVRIPVSPFFARFSNSQERGPLWCVQTRAGSGSARSSVPRLSPFSHPRR